MNIGDNLRTLRKELRLNQEEFGRRLGVSNTAISKLEKSERNLTEQMALAICREFRANYYYLMEGELPMFIGTPESVVDEIAEDYNLDEIDKKIIEKYLELRENDRKAIKEYLKSIFT